MKKLLPIRFASLPIQYRSFLSIVLIGGLLICVAGWLAAVNGSADEKKAPPKAKPAAKTKPPAKPVKLVIVAHVGEEPIYAGEVIGALNARLNRPQATPQVRRRLEAEMLEQLIRQRLVIRYLKRKDEAISRFQIDAEVKQRKAMLAERKTTLEKYLKQLGITEQALRANLEWNLSWRKYLGKHLTDEVLKKYFQKHARDYDGTKMRVRQILFGLGDEKSKKTIAELKLRAEKLRARIARGEINFAAAAEKFSDAPSKTVGGDQGWISRHGEMPEPFSATAFALAKGETSLPVVSPFGVHLIQCTEIKPGQKKWSDVKVPLIKAVAGQAFKRIVAAERKRVKVEYTGAGPYLEPGTGRLNSKKQ